MKKLIAYTTSAALMIGMSLSAIAAEKSHEDMCKEKAAKEKIAADKTDAFVKECMSKMHHHASSGQAGAATPSTPAAPAQ